jgi:hypothetical protein
VEHIEEIIHATYERKRRGPREGTKGINSNHISISVEPINPCVTNTLERTPPFRKPNFIGRNTTRSTSIQGATIGAASLGSISQGSTSHRGSISSFMMVGHDPTIRFSGFKGEASEDLEKHLLICEKYLGRKIDHG